MKPYRHLIGLVLIAIVATVALALAPTTQPKHTTLDQLDLLVDVRHELVGQYVEEPDQDKMVTAAVRAMVDSLKDPYTVFFLPKEIEDFDKQVRGSFSGIGAEVDVHDGWLRIVSPLEDSPAWKAGIMPGDLVLEINGVTTEGKKIGECIGRLTGPEGTKVTVKIRHSDGQETTLTITRARIVVETVTGLRRNKDLHWDYVLDKPNHIGYVRITQFAEKTPEALRAALDELFKQDVRGLIIDVRFNPGGLLEAATEIADMFLDEGQTIVSVKGRVVPERVSKADGVGKIAPIPIVIVANEGSASAAEILTGALSDNHRALFVGTRTFGKGSVQQVRMLEGGLGALKITNAYYYLPNGRNIHRRPGKDVWGVDPDAGCYVPMNGKQIEGMIKARQELKLAKSDDTAASPQWIEEKLKDPQLAAALRAALNKLQTGKWSKVGKDGATELALETRRGTLLQQKEMLQRRLNQIDDELAGKKPAGSADEEDNGLELAPATQPEAPATGPEAPATQPQTAPAP